MQFYLVNRNISNSGEYKKSFDIISKEVSCRVASILKNLEILKRLSLQEFVECWMCAKNAGTKGKMVNKVIFPQEIFLKILQWAMAGGGEMG